MQLHNYLLFAVSCVVSFLPLSANAADSVQGQVVDSNGKPLAKVSWKISGIEELNNGKWTRVMRSGIPRDETTDANGRFAITFREAVRYDLQFHKFGFAPAFVYEVGADSSAIVVTLKRGESIHGTVMHLVDGNYKPLIGEAVELRLPSMDVWYQERVITDTKGTFKFQACSPPSGTKDQLQEFKPKWQVACAGKIVEIDVTDGQPVEPIHFKIEVSVDKKTNVGEQPAQRSSDH
jgi:hypothetical protein